MFKNFHLLGAPSVPAARRVHGRCERGRARRAAGEQSTGLPDAELWLAKVASLGSTYMRLPLCVLKMLLGTPFLREHGRREVKREWFSSNWNQIHRKVNLGRIKLNR